MNSLSCHAKQEHRELRALGVKRTLGERHQGQCAAFTLVVGAKQNEHIFGGDDEEEGPKDQRQHAEYRRARDFGVRACRFQRHAKRVERAGADVAVNDTHVAALGLRQTELNLFYLQGRRFFGGRR